MVACKAKLIARYDGDLAILPILDCSNIKGDEGHFAGVRVCYSVWIQHFGLQRIAMPRQKRADEGGCVYHALNRGNGRQTIFHKDEDYEAFLRVLGEGLDRYPVELFSFTLMPNHWHLVLRPSEDGFMGRMLRWVTATHTHATLPRSL